ncbi:MAG: hypothetical protein HZA93_29300 [Verrucomicrobia bacterium]|nr:hypothetical protein [Verrucomicrobiota bacterium]
MSARNLVTLVVTRQPDGLWRAESGCAWADSTTPELAARQLAGLLLGVTPDRIDLRRAGPRLFTAQMRGEGAKLFWWIFAPLAIGAALSAAWSFLAGGGR